MADSSDVPDMGQPPAKAAPAAAPEAQAGPAPATAPEAPSTPPRHVEKTDWMRLCEFYLRHKGYKDVRWTGGPVAGRGPGPHPWVCHLSLSGGSVGDFSLPDWETETTANTKREAERKAGELAWQHLVAGGYVDAEKRGNRPTWVPPKRWSEGNTLAYADISIDGEQVGRVIMEFFVDFPNVKAASAFASLFGGQDGGARPWAEGCAWSLLNADPNPSIKLLLPTEAPSPSLSPAPSPPEYRLVHQRRFLITYRPAKQQPPAAAAQPDKQAPTTQPPAQPAEGGPVEQQDPKAAIETPTKGEAASPSGRSFPVQLEGEDAPPAKPSEQAPVQAAEGQAPLPSSEQQQQPLGQPPVQQQEKEKSEEPAEHFPSAGSLVFTTTMLPALNGTHEVVGQVLKGFGVLREVQDKLQAAFGQTEEAPPRCVVSGCGLCPPDLDLNDVPPYQEDGLPLWPDDMEECPLDTPSEVLFRRNLAATMREAGNKAYQEGQYARAIRKYTQATRFVNFRGLRSMRPRDLNPELKEQMIGDSDKCLLNRAACYLNLGQYPQAVADCREVLSRQPDQPKALFRLGQAYMGTKQVEEAVEALKAAAKREPGNVAVRGALEAAKQALKDKKAREAQALGKVIGTGAFAGEGQEEERGGNSKD